MSSLEETLGVKNVSDLNGQIKSTLGKKHGQLDYKWVSDSSVVVYIDKTDKNGSKTKENSPSATDCQCIYAGPVELWN